MNLWSPYLFLRSKGNIGLFQVVLVVKNPPANGGDIRDVGLIPGLGRSPGGGTSVCSSLDVSNHEVTDS